MYFPDERPFYKQTKDTYIFKKQIEKNIVYIKIHINDDELLVECWSFHKDHDRRS